MLQRTRFYTLCNVRQEDSESSGRPTALAVHRYRATNALAHWTDQRAAASG